MAIKWLFDKSVAAIALLVLSPVFFIVAIAIWATDRGPILYKQQRIGKNQQPFSLYKFRSMRVQPNNNQLLTIGNDSRITPIGRFIRQYKIDELPQLFNVLNGSMSLVGPRPEVAKYVNLYSTSQLKVLSVKPGITDWASIKYSNESELLAKAENPEEFYVSTIMPDKLALNLEYIKNQSFFLDVKIVINTIFKVSKH